MDRKKVLIIDDEIDLCLLLKSYFVRKNFEVVVSHSIKEGLTIVKDLKPDILFIDNNLPDGTGWGAAPALAEAYPHMHINLISAYHPAPPQMPQGANFTVLEKPISLVDIDRQLQGQPG